MNENSARSGISMTREAVTLEGSQFFFFAWLEAKLVLDLTAFTRLKWERYSRLFYTLIQSAPSTNSSNRGLLTTRGATMELYQRCRYALE